MPFDFPGDGEKTREPFATVDARLEPGRYVFRLEVVNERGQMSAPADVTVEVLFPVKTR
jgi:hypothetical protein